MAVGVTRRARRAGAAAWGVVVALLVCGGPARAQFFSPGPLAKPHRELEGLDNCLRCHSEERGLSPARCLACHTELAPGLKAETGLHGRLPPDQRNACEGCHPDHRGRDFSLVDWGRDRNKFDHTRTGWRLEGAHAKTRCESCHRRAFVTTPEAVELLRSAPQHVTYLGLQRRCTTCHFDEHRGQLGGECLSCHTQVSWKPAPGFRHERTAFPLRGKHAGVACAKCHPTMEDEDGTPGARLARRADSFLQMKPVDHRTCQSCHEDPHQGRFGPACANCHNESGWRAVVVKAKEGQAFHDQTRFPLLGSHIGVACRGCHGPSPGTPVRYKGIPFSRCDDCHHDAHVGQLALDEHKRPPDCARCHTVDGFAPVHFEVEQHAATKFVLEGAHAVAACRGCHALDERLSARVPVGVRRRLRLEKRPLEVSLAVLRLGDRPEACSGCHADPHAGQFAAEIERNDCGGCHGTDSFHAVTFDHKRHSRFALEGSHATLACGACHRPERLQADGPAVVRYRPLAVACSGCHADEHQGQFDRIPPRATGAAVLAAVAGGAGAPAREGSADCASCHRTTKFAETLFSHDDPQFTRFVLRGKHAALACDRCHGRVEVAPGVRTVWYRGVPTACMDCHVDFHHGDFRGLEP